MEKASDLFDLAVVLNQFGSLDINSLLRCFEHYMASDSKKNSRAEFELNLHDKLNDSAFIGDITPLLPYSMSNNYDPLLAAKIVQDKIISSLSGDIWKGRQHES